MSSTKNCYLYINSFLYLFIDFLVLPQSPVKWVKVGIILISHTGKSWEAGKYSLVTQES